MPNFLAFQQHGNRLKRNIVHLRLPAKIWEYKLSRRGINTSVTVVGEQVFSAHGEENLNGNTQGAVVCLNAGTANGEIPADGAVWWKPKSPSMKCRWILMAVSI